MTSVLIAFITFFDRILKRLILFSDIISNRIIFFKNDVEFISYPLINGKIKISNKGRAILGRSVKFNSSLGSNYVGLFKPCTIAIEKNAVLKIGDFSGFSGVSIYCSCSIEIGNYVNCGGNVCIWDTDFHPLNFSERRAHQIVAIKKKGIQIGDDVFIGANSIILKGVQIGDRAIIGAGSVVTRNIGPDEVWGGNPAKFIKDIL